MQISGSLLKNEEKVIMELRSIYRAHGYSCFKMSKFEPYDLYSQHKDFLVSDSVITFNDTNGTLMALKPDVTLSIVKNFDDTKSGVRRLYYNENVYRVSDKTQQFREVCQTGLECLGQLTPYHLYETVSLAASSLARISPQSVLNISDLDILCQALKNVTDPAVKRRLLTCIGQKNAHGVREVCVQNRISSRDTDFLCFLCQESGDPEKVATALARHTGQAWILAAAQRLKDVATQASAVSGIRVQVDLSLCNDMNYYNGIVFQGFVSGVPTAVVRGGQYDRLMEKMGKQAKAIGFAVYLDLLERLNAPSRCDADVLLLIGEHDDPRLVQSRAEALIRSGKSVSVQTAMDDSLVCRTVERFGEKE